ncbi:MAG: GNAT family N-acetyltransferase [Acidobacteriia bacterium]|nr:GNAT family N-acetyltransferase [Terriglobia bacterium]
MFQRTVAPGIEIRQFAPADAEGIFAVADRNRAYLREWLPWVDQTRSAAEVREFIERSRAQLEANQGPNAGIWIEGALCGSLGCHPIDWSNRNCSIGYWIEACHQGKGVITRCCAVLLDYLFDDMGLHRVEIRCATGNTRSCAIPERLGFTREGVAREAEWVNDRWLDLVVWGMLERTWRASAGSRTAHR